MNIASNFVYSCIWPLRNTFAKTLTKSTMRQKATSQRSSNGQAPLRLHGLRLAGKYGADTDVRRRFVEVTFVFRMTREVSPSLLNWEKEGKKKIYRSPHQRIAALIDFKTSRRNVKRLCNFLALVTPQLKITPILPRQRHIDATDERPLFTLAISLFWRIQDAPQFPVFVGRFGVDPSIIFTQFLFCYVNKCIKP